MGDVVIVGGIRTPVGSFGGSLKLHQWFPLVHWY